jgi:hypothetical protein
MYGSEEGCWHLLWAIKQLRDRLIKLDRELRLPFEQMCKRLRVPLPSKDVLQDSKRELIQEAEARLATETPFCWIRSATLSAFAVWRQSARKEGSALVRLHRLALYALLRLGRRLGARNFNHRAICFYS